MLLPAAFGRLCVETREYFGDKCLFKSQPPSGGCVLKPASAWRCVQFEIQPPSGGCVLKLYYMGWHDSERSQPPSGGCVLKPMCLPATIIPIPQPPSGGCVLKPSILSSILFHTVPAAFGRLCVETLLSFLSRFAVSPSRLRAAVC